MKMEDFVRRMEEEIRSEDDVKKEESVRCEHIGDPQIHKKRKIAIPSCNLQRKKHVAEINTVEKKESGAMSCGKCGKRLKLTNNYSCRCGNTYCIMHRFHDQHGCTFDYKAMAIAKLSAQNPKIVGKKVGEP
ncbi:hypothetical protein EHEL_040200 [Encephalitozoon hellem ATCC 50504]|uniref:AN1-type domain-containing protein n=1 Tax=Encephalitozoon hellem TaxID=27973 RepID=A0A9Q9C9U0_ENCHE|nr:uncharacterized protein EHEL_040200 [Encephalitozoon hellem ATCC 50504]AFM98072.1 hypothetical protein EHEL_040200 [Encephalitozoon hellem ATCC 50504]UTX42913.1 hypothetical protein GPU96_04g06430 [Encephalitozoon hellem]|eukprot:XP_003887053.1 hypothetical protein EHEL_040200 [Encephalitozoon hellem ATCC 50504]